MPFEKARLANRDAFAFAESSMRSAGATAHAAFSISEKLEEFVASLEADPLWANSGAWWRDHFAKSIQPDLDDIKGIAAAASHQGFSKV